MQPSYKKIEKYLSKDEKKDLWEISIGLNKVDNLQQSELFYTLVNKELDNKTNYNEMREVLSHYYKNKNITDNCVRNEREADLVAIRIVEFLSSSGFSFSIGYFKDIHRFLFQDVFHELDLKYLGEFRDYDFTKDEPILNGKSVEYASAESLEKILNYDFSVEKKVLYYKQSQQNIIQQISNFTSNIWQAHPFVEGNTRTTAVFIEKYMKNQGLNVMTNIFKENSLYFRNALVFSNYSPNPNGIYLSNFFEKCLYNAEFALQPIEPIST